MAIDALACPLRIQVSRAASSSGQSAGVCSTDSSSSPRARIWRTPSRCIGSPECEAQTSARCSPARSSPARSMPTACSGFSALRGYIGANSAPTERRLSRPSASVTATRPRCTLSTYPLRTTSTRIGSASKGLPTLRIYAQFAVTPSGSAHGEHVPTGASRLRMVVGLLYVNWNDFDAALFDLDGVLTPTAEVHMRAWQALFTDFLTKRGIRRPALRRERLLRLHRRQAALRRRALLPGLARHHPGRRRPG